MRRALLLALALAGCGPSIPQILAMGDWSATARANCSTPGKCPLERACILAVIHATEPGAVTAKSYTAARMACQRYGAP